MKIKNDNASLAIFALTVALIAVTLNWVGAVCFAAGWMIRQYMWVKHITKVLPDLRQGRGHQAPRRAQQEQAELMSWSLLLEAYLLHGH